MQLLATGDAGDFGIHSEMFTTGLMRLHKAGKVSNRRKGQFDGFSVTTFAAGTAELYEWLDGNDAVRFLPVDIVNSPETISQEPGDGHHQRRARPSTSGARSAADTLDGRQFSGIGGHEDFVSVSGLELGDRSVICLPSTATMGDTVVSRIVAALPEGMVVTTPRHQLDLVATEFGVAHLRGRTVRERAFALATIAHPDHRADLERRAALLD